MEGYFLEKKVKAQIKSIFLNYSVEQSVIFWDIGKKNCAST